MPPEYVVRLCDVVERVTLAEFELGQCLLRVLLPETHRDHERSAPGTEAVSCETW